MCYVRLVEFILLLNFINDSVKWKHVCVKSIFLAVSPAQTILKKFKVLQEVGKVISVMKLVGDNSTADWVLREDKETAFYFRSGEDWIIIFKL